MKIDGQIMKNEERAVFKLRGLYRQYGYAPYKMNRFEEYELYVRNKDFLVSEEVITFTDSSGRLLALKPDVTLSIIKNTRDQAGFVQKVYYNENVFRIAKGTHTFKEIMQAGLECIGDLGAYEIAEVLLLAVKSLELIGENYVLDLSHMGLISAVLESCGVSDAGKEQLLAALNQKNVHELEEICRAEALSEAAMQKMRALIACYGPPEQALAGLKPLLETAAEKTAFDSFCALFAILEQCGFAEKIRVDFSVGNDMKYYSGVVFKGYLEGIPASVLSGGQYDKLLRKMGRKSGAIGFAVYLDLLERLAAGEPAYDVEVVLRHDRQEEPACLVAAAERLAAEGSVLVAKEIPPQVKWRRLMRLREGRLEAVE